MKSDHHALLGEADPGHRETEGAMILELMINLGRTADQQAEVEIDFPGAEAGHQGGHRGQGHEGDRDVPRADPAHDPGCGGLALEAGPDHQRVLCPILVGREEVT